MEVELGQNLQTIPHLVKVPIMQPPLLLQFHQNWPASTTTKVAKNVYNIKSATIVIQPVNAFITHSRADFQALVNATGKKFDGPFVGSTSKP